MAAATVALNSLLGLRLFDSVHCQRSMICSTSTRWEST